MTDRRWSGPEDPDHRDGEQSDPDGWPQSSLSNSSLDDARLAAEADPFSREGAARQEAQDSQAPPPAPEPPQPPDQPWQQPYPTQPPPAQHVPQNPYQDPYPQNPYPQDPYRQSPYAPSPYAQNPHVQFQGQSAAPGPYGQVPYGLQPVALQHPQATTVLVCGIIGIAAFPPVGVVAFFLGQRVRREIAVNPTRWSGVGMVNAGWALGIVSLLTTAFLIFGIIVGITAGGSS